MSQRYPSSTVWFIECRSAGKPLEQDKPNASGSGVSIWLRKRGNNDPGKRYILTCQHVVREGRTGTTLDVIRVWQPGSGYTGHTEAKRARVSIITPMHEVWPEGSQHAGDDWVLLEVDDEEFTQSADCIRKVAGPSFIWNSLIGYPGGAAGLKHGSVLEPICSHGFRRLAVFDAAIHLLGSEEAAEGMSGGGLFSLLGAFAGLHRSTMQKGVVKRSVAASHIRRQLSARGYDIVEPGALPSPIRLAFKVACILLALALIFAFESGQVGDSSDATSFLGRMQRKYSTLNLHLFNRHLNCTITKTNSFIDRVRCYQTVTLRGESNITKTIVVDKGGTLVITEGALFRFSPETGIECYGRLQITGEDDSPVTLEGRDNQTWCGIFLSGAGANDSSLNNCNVSRGSGSRVDPTGNSYVSISDDGADSDTLKDATSFVPPPLRFGGDSVKQYGGALCIDEVSGVSIKQCMFEKCSAELGGAIHFYKSSNATIENCVFRSNVVMPMLGKSIAAAGGAVSVVNSFGVDFRYCEFEENKALSQWSCGGAVSVNFRGSATFSNCEFKKNVASHAGGAFYCLSLRPQFAKGSVSESESFSRDISFIECTFSNNRTLRRFHNPRASVWENHGHEIAVDAGCTVRLGQCDFTSGLSDGRLVHIDSGADQKGNGSTLADNRARLTIMESTFNVMNESAAIIAPWDEAKDRVNIIAGNIQIRRHTEATQLPGIVGIVDDLMPSEKAVSGKTQRYSRPRIDGTSVDTIVMHHVSAINWDAPNALDSGVKADAELRLGEIPAASKMFSPEFCKAIFESYGVSTHYLITREGCIRRLVPHSEVAFHAGESMMPNPPDAARRVNVNEFSIGIELIAVHPDDYGKVPSPQDRAYTDEQYRSLVELLMYLHGQLWGKSGASSLKMVVGHDEVSGIAAVKAGRRKGPPKTDPGPDVEWKRIRHEDFSPILDIR